MFNIIYLNYIPNIITESEFNDNILYLNDYLDYISIDKRLGFTFCTSAYVKLKKITEAKRLNIPLISIADLDTNLKWIDYPILIAKSDKINSFFFFNMIVGILFSCIYLKKKKYITLYNNYNKLNFLKEIILKSELKKKNV